MKIIINENQLEKIKESVLPVPKKMNKPYSINPYKVIRIKRFLDNGFKKGNFENIGNDGLPCDVKIVGMISKQGEVLKNLYLEQLVDLLIEKFKYLFNDELERELFMKQVVNDWYDNKIGPFGTLTVNHL